MQGTYYWNGVGWERAWYGAPCGVVVIGFAQSAKDEGTEMYTTECHICGERVKLHPATVKQAYEHGYDAAYVGEYLVGTCRKREHEDGTRTHYGYPSTLVHHSEADEA